MMASYLLVNGEMMNGRDDAIERHYSLEPDLGTSSCSYESVLSSSTDHLGTVPQQKSLQDRQRLALEFTEQSSGCAEDNLSDIDAMAAIHEDLKVEMSVLSSWVTDASSQFSTDDFDDDDQRSGRSISGNGFFGRARTRESNGRLSFVAPDDQQLLHANSSPNFPRSGSSQQVFTQPLKGLGNSVSAQFLPRHHEPQQHQHYYHEQQLESIQQLQHFQVPRQFSSFDDTTVTMGLPSFGSSSGDQSDDSLIIDQWDRGMSPPTEKRQRLVSPSPIPHSPSVIHHAPVGLSSIRDTLPSNRPRLDEGAVESTKTNGMIHGGGGSILSAAGRGVTNIKGINEMLSRFNPGQGPPPAHPPATALSQQQQPHLQSSFSSVVNRKSMQSTSLEVSPGSNHCTQSPFFENQERISTLPGNGDGLVSSRSTKRGLEEGWPPSPGLLSKGFNNLGASHDANTMEQLLAHCAEALEKKDVNSAHQVMWVLNGMVSAEGDPNQRVTSCFLKALVRRAGSLVPSFNAMYGEEKASKLVSAVEYAVMVDITPWYRFGFKAANGAMLEAFEGRDRVHIIDFTTTYGMQWPTLIEALSNRPEGPPYVRLTVHNARPDVAPYLGMSQEDVVSRLIMFAATKSVELDVTIVPHVIELLDRSMFDIRNDEVTVVNCMYRVRFIPDESANPSSSGQCSSPRDDFFEMVHSLNPSLVTMVDEEANVTSSSLVTRLKAAFNYLWIPFDSLDTFLPRDSPQRLEYELVLAKKIENIIVSEGLDRIERMETKERWGQRMRKAGFELVLFSEDVSEEVKIMLSDHAAGWGMKQDEDAMLLTWKGHNVLFATVWRPSSSTSPSVTV